MEGFAHLGLAPADILLPNCNLSKWSVIACDQFTAQPHYWRRVEERVGDSPSSLRLILPEARLRGDDEAAGAEEIHAAMQRYLEQNLFYACPDSMVYVERAVTAQRPQPPSARISSSSTLPVKHQTVLCG